MKLISLSYIFTLKHQSIEFLNKKKIKNQITQHILLAVSMLRSQSNRTAPLLAPGHNPTSNKRIQSITMLTNQLLFLLKI